MGNQPSSSGTMSSLNQTQLEETQNSLLNRYQFNQINGKLKLNGTEVHPEEIRDLLSNKNAQRVIMQKAFENGWENISQEFEQDEKFIQNINHLAPFEGSGANIGSDNEMTLNQAQLQQGYAQSIGPMKNQQFIQHMQKQGENSNEESIQQSSVQEGTKYSEQMNSRGNSQNMNKIFNVKNDSKNGSISFGPTGIFKNGFSRNLSQRSNQSDSIMQFNCEELSARNNNVFNHNLSNRQSSRRNGFQQSGNQILTNIKETEDSVEKDYSNYQEIDVIIPEINFQITENRKDVQNKNSGVINQQGKQNSFNNSNNSSNSNNRQYNLQPSVQFDNDQNNYESNNTQQLHVENLSQNYNSLVPNNSSIYQYQTGFNEAQEQEVPKKYLNLEQLIRSRKNSKQTTDGFLSANAQESGCGQSPLNAELVRNFMVLNESQLSSHQADLNPRQLEILRELIKEDHILKTIHKTLQSQQNSSREMQNQPQSRIQLINKQNQEENQQASFRVIKQLQQAFECEASEEELNKQEQQMKNQNNHLNIYDNYEIDHHDVNNNNTFKNYQQNIQDQQIRQNKFQNAQFIQQSNQSNIQNNFFMQRLIYNKQQNMSTQNENISTKQKPNVSVDQNTKNEFSKETFSNRMNDASSLKGPIVYTEQPESSDNMSQCYIEGYSYRTNNSFKSLEQKKRSISQNTFGNNQINNRSTNSFYQQNDEKQQISDFLNNNNTQLNGQNACNGNQSLNNSINLQGIQFKICASVNSENVKNPIKKIRSFSSNSRSNQQSQNNMLQDSVNGNNCNEQQSINNNMMLNFSQDTFKNMNMQRTNVFQTSAQMQDQQNTIKSNNQIKFNQLNILSSQLQSTKNQNSLNSIQNQFNPISNKSVKDNSNYFLNYNNSMNNSFNLGLNSSIGDCQNVNQSFEKKFRKLRGASHQDNNNNRNSFINSSNNIQVQGSNHQINEDSQQHYMSLLNAIPTINTQAQINTNSSFQVNQQAQLFTHPNEDVNQNQRTQEASINFKNQRQAIQIAAYESVSSQKSSGLKAFNCKENYESISNKNKQNQIISFNSSNKMRFMTIQEQTENSNYPSMYSVQMQQQQNQQIQTQLTRQSLVSQQERQSKIVCTEAEKESCIYSDLKSQHTMNSQQKPEIKNISGINQNMRRNNTYFNSNNPNEEEIKSQDYEFNKYFCKNVQSISNTPLSKGVVESSSSRVVSRSVFQQQNKENEVEEIQSMSSLIKYSQNAQSMTKNFSNSNIQQGIGKTEALPQSISSKALLKRENSGKTINKVLNESHIQFTSKKPQQGPQSSVNASYIYSPSKQIQVNIMQHDQTDINIITPNQSCLSKNAAMCLFGDQQMQSNDNSFIANNVPLANRSNSTDCRPSVQTNYHEVRKTITGIKKFRSQSNNNSFITNQSDQNFFINNESDYKISLNNSKIQYNNQNQKNENQSNKEEQINLQDQRWSNLYKKMGEKHEINIHHLKENSENFTIRNEDNFLQDENIIQNEENHNNHCKTNGSNNMHITDKNNNHNTNAGLFDAQKQNLLNTFQNIEDAQNSNLKESTIYQRNKYLIEQIKQSNQDIFERQETNYSGQKDESFEEEIIQSEQKFSNCNQQTTQKEKIVELDYSQQAENALKKQSSQLSQREKSQNQYSDNKYKRNDLKLNDSIDFNKNQNENNDQEYYDMKILNLQQNTKLTNESQEKMKEMMKKMKEAQQNNKQQQGQKDKIQESYQDQKQFNSLNKNETPQMMQTNQIFIYSASNQSFENQNFQNENRISKVEYQSNGKQQRQVQLEDRVNNFDSQNNKILQKSGNKQNNDQFMAKYSGQKLNMQNSKSEENKVDDSSQIQNLNHQSQTFYLDTFKQQYFEQGEEEDDDELVNQGEQFDQDNQINYQLQQDIGTASCLTETSRKDNQCLDEISQQLQYLKQRSRNMDYSIQSEINVLEEKVAKIFTKIKFEKSSKSKESSFVGSVNHQNNSNNIIFNQLPSSNISSVQNKQNNQKRMASYTTASNSNTSSKFLSQQQYQNASQSQQHMISCLGQNLQSYENNFILNDIQIEEQDSQTPIDQPLDLEQPESQFIALSIDTLGQTTKSKNIDNKISRSLLNYNTSNNYNQDSLKRYDQYNTQFNNNQSMFNQIEEPYEAQDDNNNSNIYILSGSKQSNKNNLKTDGQNEQGNFFKNNTKYRNKNELNINDIQIKQEFNKSQEMSNSNQQFSDYFEQQVNKNNLPNKDLLNQQESFYSSISNRIPLNSATNRSQLQGVNQNSIKRSESNLQMINNGVLCSSSSNRSSSKLSALNYGNSSNTGDRQKKDLELLKIMHILEENPNNVISSIKQFETLDSQQMHNELAQQQQQQQSQYDFEQQQQSAKQFKNNQEKVTRDSDQNNFQFEQNQNIKQYGNFFVQQNNQTKQSQENYQSNFFKNQQNISAPLFEMSIQEWQNASASFPNNYASNNGGNQYQQNHILQLNQENQLNITQQYGQIPQQNSLDYHNEEVNSFQQYVSKQLMQNRARLSKQANSVNTKRQQVNDLSDKENKIPEQKVNLIELLQKKQQQQLQSQSQQKKTLLVLQEQNINIQLDFNTPIISTKSNQNQFSKFKNENDEENQFDDIIQYQQQGQNQLNYNRRNHHLGYQYQNVSERVSKLTPDKCMSSQNISANTSKSNTSKKILNSRSSSKILSQNPSSQVLSDYQNQIEEQKNQRQKTHEKITQLYKQHQNFILKQEKMNQELDVNNSSSSVNYWKIRNADSRKRSRNSSNSGPRSTGKEKNNGQQLEKEKNPKSQLSEIVSFLNQQQRMNKPILDIIKQNNINQNEIKKSQLKNI